MLRPFLISSIAISTIAGQAASLSFRSAASRPVRDVTIQPKVEGVEFVGFEFQQPAIYEATVHYGPIEGEPSIGVQYGVQASIDGEAAIETVSFDAIDDGGSTIQRIAIARQSNGAGESDFLGLMTVPDRPFRVRLSGESVDGRSFTRVYRHRFKPSAEPPDDLPYPSDLPSEMAAQFQRMFDDLAPAAIAERQALVTGHAAGRIVMPHTAISNVTYAPLLGPSGRPVGLRMRYEATFSQSGAFNPLLVVAPFAAPDSFVGSNDLPVLKGTIDYVLNATIDPRPHQVEPPNAEAEDVAGRGYQRAYFLYNAGTVYRFTVDLVPEFIHVEKRTMMPCLERRVLDRYPAKALAQLSATDAPTNYGVSIAGTTFFGRAFEGRVADFYGPATFYQSVVAEGLRDCSSSAGVYF